MKGYKDSTKTQYLRGGAVKAEAKIGKVMGEFKAGTLHSGSSKGPKVANRKQAVAIAMSEARKAGAKLPMKKAEGGAVRSRKKTAEQEEIDRRVATDILKRDMADIEAYDRERNKRVMGLPWSPTKMTTLAAEDAARRQNRLGVRFQGYGVSSAQPEAEYGVGLKPKVYKTPKFKEGGPVENKTGTRRDPEYGDFVIAGQAQKPAPRARRVPAASTTPRVQPTPQTQQPRSRAMFGDEAAAAHSRGGEEAMRAAERREGFKAGGGVSTTGKRLMKKYGGTGC